MTYYTVGSARTHAALTRMARPMILLLVAAILEISLRFLFEDYSWQLGSWVAEKTLAQYSFYRPSVNLLAVVAIEFFLNSFPVMVLLVYIYERSDRHRTGSSETRCRKCSYILRGLSKPECPECGESI